MTEIRTKDKIFLAIVVPAAVAALYWFGWREGEWRKIDALRQRQSALVSQEDFDDEMARANRQVRAAREELAAERNVAAPASKVKGNAGESEAERGRAVVETLRAAGLKIVRSEVSDGAQSVLDALKRTAVRPNPTVRRWTVDGAYPALMSALDGFVSGELALVPVSVSIKPPSRVILTVVF